MVSQPSVRYVCVYTRRRITSRVMRGSTNDKRNANMNACYTHTHAQQMNEPSH